MRLPSDCLWVCFYILVLIFINAVMLCLWGGFMIFLVYLLVLVGFILFVLWEFVGCFIELTNLSLFTLIDAISVLETLLFGYVCLFY